MVGSLGVVVVGPLGVGVAVVGPLGVGVAVVGPLGVGVVVAGPLGVLGKAVGPSGVVAVGPLVVGVAVVGPLGVGVVVGPLVVGVVAWEGLVYATCAQEGHSLVVEALGEVVWAGTMTGVVDAVQEAPTWYSVPDKVTLKMNNTCVQYQLRTKHGVRERGGGK